MIMTKITITDGFFSYECDDNDNDDDDDNDNDL